MRSFNTVLVLAATFTIALGDLHHNAVCVNTGTGSNVYNDDATKQACASYLGRNTGSEAWDQCPDCVMIETGIPHCQSDAEHLGGDEITAYCKSFGADNALTS